MKLFLATHDAHFIGPGMTLVLAESEEIARAMVAEEIKKHGLSPFEIVLEEIKVDQPFAKVIWDGDY
mgnify:CR=1 FL=1|jgi:hypothetical protein